MAITNIDPTAFTAFNKSYAEWEHELEAASRDDAFDVLCDAYLAPLLKSHERDNLLKLAAKRLGSTQRKLLTTMQEEGVAAKKRSHLDVAKAVAGIFGDGNLVYAQGAFHAWRERGAWERISDRVIRKHAAACIEQQEAATDGNVHSVVNLCRDHVHDPDANFDRQHSRRINVENGTLLYQGGSWALGKHDRGDFLTTMLPVSYDPTAECPRFDRFLDEIFEGDSDAGEKRQAVLEMIGYSLLQLSQFEKFALLVGHGANGKSVLLDVVRSLVGPEQCAAVDPTRLTDRVERAHLRGKLVNIAPELPVGSMLPDAQIKAITSGDLVSAAAKYGQPFDFKPFATLWMGTNNMPHSRDLSHGMFRRTLIITFNRRFEGAGREIGLADRLRGELPGILRLVLDALSGLIERGEFTTPASSIQAVQNWRADCDQVIQFVESECLRGPQYGPVSHAELFAEFRRWATEQNIKHSVSGKTFTERLAALGLEHGRYRDKVGQHRGFMCIEPAYRRGT